MKVICCSEDKRQLEVTGISEVTDNVVFLDWIHDFDKHIIILNPIEMFDLKRKVS